MENLCTLTSTTSTHGRYFAALRQVKTDRRNDIISAYFKHDADLQPLVNSVEPHLWPFRTCLADCADLEDVLI